MDPFIKLNFLIVIVLQIFSLGCDIDSLIKFNCFNETLMCKFSLASYKTKINIDPRMNLDFFIEI